MTMAVQVANAGWVGSPATTARFRYQGADVGTVAVPALDPEDHHVRPAWVDAIDAFAIELDPLAAAPEYPLAVAFNPADPSNYVANGIADHEYVVVHTMQGSYAGTISWFKNPASNVSTHFVMRSGDGEVTQMVNLADRAWHVGSSNSYAIGIEHEGYIDDPEKWYTWATYTSSARLTRWCADQFAIPLSRDHIVGHVELPNQSHTDPGGGWKWDLYMALIWDLVGEGEIEGVVVDRSRGCVLTANKETWLKRTAEPADKLAAGDRCLVPAGAQITYYWASIDHVGDRRLVMESGVGPCANQNGLDQAAFITASDFSGLCDPASMGAAGATVTIDGGEAKAIGADGAFAFPPRSAGLYTLGSPAAATRR